MRSLPFGHCWAVASIVTARASTALKRIPSIVRPRMRSSFHDYDVSTGHGSPRSWPDAGDSGAGCQGVSWARDWAILWATHGGRYAGATRHLRSEAGLADRGRSSVLRPRGHRAPLPDPGRAVRGPDALGPRVAGAGGPALPHRRGGGAAGRRLQRVESRQPARAL